ncbi:MAG: haloacid dehalogenase-like hydrolase [Myxococcales bacterium]|nr:haloacid dehalogenase-like hydrolase [Myxococcales bacterium]
MKTLAIFDIDETLIHTRKGWPGVFGASIRRVLGEATVAQVDEREFTHVTAAGIVQEIYQRRLGRQATASELQAICDAQLQRLDAVPPPPPVEGARALLSMLQQSPGFRVAIGSGNFGAVMRYKLRATGFDEDRYPMGSCDDDISRAGLIHAAVARAERLVGHGFERIVYVGDALWDVVTARTMGLPLVGVAADGDCARLTDAGVSHVLKDYRDTEAVLNALTEARVPAAAAP